VKTIIKAYEKQGHSAHLLNQHNGFVEVRITQRGYQPRSMGIFEVENMKLALEKFENAVEIINIISSAA
jgi:hypothetical protein